MHAILYLSTINLILIESPILLPILMSLRFFTARPDESPMVPDRSPTRPLPNRAA